MRRGFFYNACVDDSALDGSSARALWVVQAPVNGILRLRRFMLTFPGAGGDSDEDADIVVEIRYDNTGPSGAFLVAVSPTEIGAPAFPSNSCYWNSAHSGLGTLINAFSVNNRSGIDLRFREMPPTVSPLSRIRIGLPNGFNVPTTRNVSMMLSLEVLGGTS